MKMLFCRTMNWGEKNMLEGFCKIGLEVDEIQIGTDGKVGKAELGAAELENKLRGEGYLFVFSFHFYSIVSAICQKLLLPYISYIIRWPVLELCCPEVKNSCNFIFVFDRELHKKMLPTNPERVFYLPCATGLNEEGEKSERMEVSFVGSMYKAYPLLEDMKGASEFLRGYVDAWGEAQMKVYGCSLLSDGLSRKAVDELSEIIQTESFFVERTSQDSNLLVELYMEGLVTRKERERLLCSVAGRHRVELFTPDLCEERENLTYRGKVSCEEELKTIYAESKINLNITPRNVTTGIPQKVFDIMGAGGFVLTNFQPELLEYFNIGEELDMFSSQRELLEKIEYYLQHEEERRAIAQNGQRIVQKYHMLEQRAQTMINTVFSEI